MSSCFRASKNHDSEIEDVQVKNVMQKLVTERQFQISFKQTFS